MGHTVDTYDDVRSKGVEFLRNVYASSGLSIKPKTKVSKIDALKEIIRAWGMDPEKILAREALSEPHRTHVGYEEREDCELQSLSKALKEIVKKELLGLPGRAQRLFTTEAQLIVEAISEDRRL